MGHLNKPSIQALIHGLNRHYYSIAINYRQDQDQGKGGAGRGWKCFRGSQNCALYAFSHKGILSHTIPKNCIPRILADRKNELEERMLLNLSKSSWTAGLTLTNFQQHNENNEKVVKELKSLADRYDKVG